MKTQGVTILEPDGALLLPYMKAVPPAFWARLKHEITKRCLVDDFRADYAREGETDGAPWEREERLFRRWVERCGLAASPWPWEPGWTPERVDSYLAAPVARRDAA
jgi:hypothetical protein